MKSTDTMQPSGFVHPDFEEIINNGPYPIRFPNKVNLSQNEEFCEVQIDGVWTPIRFHDYSDVYKIPGLYETIFYRTLMCNSPHRISGFLQEVLIEHGIDSSGLRVLDFGAGNGMMGEALQNLGVRKIVGIDLLPEARKACWRDRPWVYDDYVACDFTQLSEKDESFFKDYKFNVLTTVAALGFGDIPQDAFKRAFNFVEDKGLIAFNIRDEFLRHKSNSAFGNLIDRMIQEEIIQVELYKRYRHRLSIQGEPLFYVALIATKNRSL